MKGLIKNVISHNIERFPQPEPLRNPGGDCFACALLSALRFLYPEKEFDFNKVWETYILKEESVDGTSFEHLGNSWMHYPRVLKQCKEQLDLSDFTFRQNSCHPKFTSWGCTNGNWNRDHSQYGEYWHTLCEDLKSGVVFIPINMMGEGPWKNGRWNDTDHIVLIDGVRERRVPIDGGARIDWEVHIVCSRDRGGWKTVHELLDLHGAGAWYVLEREK